MRTSNDWHNDKKHEENLRLKLKRELPEELMDECETYGQLEAKKEMMDSFKTDKSCRRKEKQKALQFEEEAYGDLLEAADDFTPVK